jgi:hypothetical protein
VGFALGWLAFTSTSTAPGRLPVFVEPVIGAAASAIAGVLVLSTLRTSRRREPMLVVLPALTATALLATHRLVLTAGPVSAFAHMTGGELLRVYEKQGAYPANAEVIQILQVTTAIGGIPVLFLSVLLAVRRLPLSKCVALCTRGFGYRPGTWLGALLLLGVMALPIFLFSTRVVWRAVLQERAPDNVAFLGTMLTIFTGLSMGVYLYFAARTVLALTDDPSVGPEVPVIERTFVPYPKRGRHSRDRK